MRAYALTRLVLYAKMQLLACAQEQAHASGGITADIFAHAVAPLLAFSCMAQHGASDRAACLLYTSPSPRD